MQLKHYPSNPRFTDIVREWDYSTHTPRGDKPKGFWVSILGENDWKSWCESEEFRTGSLENEFDVFLSESANILYLTSADDLFEFSVNYKDHSAPGHRYNDDIDWDRLYMEYDGIIISPYQWVCRLDSKTSWYYGWDCASGCIWNLSVIESVTRSALVSS